MVCFSHFRYEFPSSDRWFWTHLFAKYFPQQKLHVAQCSLDDFNTSSTVEVSLSNVWSGLSFLNATPKFVPPVDSTPDPDERIREIGTFIVNLIKGRHSHGGEEVFIMRKFPPQTSMSDVYRAFHQAAIPSCVTRCLQAPDEIWLFVDDAYPLKITAAKISDGTPPTLDLDDGFSSSGWGEEFPSHWQEAFLRWKEALQVTQGKSWDEPILPPSGNQPFEE